MTLPTTIASIPCLESQMEPKYEIHEYLDIKETKEEPADYQQSQIKIENLILDESPNDNTNLGECDEMTDKTDDVMVIENDDFEHSILKKDQPSNPLRHMKESKTQTDKSSSTSCSKNQIKLERIKKTRTYKFERYHNKSIQPSILKSCIDSLHTREKIHKCRYCGYGSPLLGNLKSHINSEHKRENIYKCQYCDYESPRLGNLLCHINSIHTREKIYKCQYCEYESPYKSALKCHINSIHTRGKIYKCQYCDYESTLLQNLLRHINFIHTREKLHKCQYCEYESPDTSALKRHINCKHTKEKILKCQYCYYRSTLMPSLKAHINTKHM